MTGRLAAYERMMQDNGEGYRSRYDDGSNNEHNQNAEKTRTVDKVLVKAGDAHARNKS